MWFLFVCVGVNTLLALTGQECRVPGAGVTALVSRPVLVTGTEEGSPAGALSRRPPLQPAHILYAAAPS